MVNRYLFPRIEWDRPEVVEKVLGSFPLKVRWSDGDGREVTSPDQPGRYAFYAEGTTTGGKKGWGAKGTLDLQFGRFSGPGKMKGGRLSHLQSASL